MLAELPGAALWMEPNFGRALAITNRPENAYEHSPLYALAGAPEHWIPAVRAFILAAGRARYPDHRRGDPLILKDQNSGEHIGRVLQAVPESRVIVLVRDPRDVMASVADVLHTAGGWAEEWLHPATRKADAEVFENYARGCAQSFEAALTACDRHPGPKAIVTYEELRANANAGLRRICDAIGLAADEDAIAAAVRAHAWERIPSAEKGPGRFHRKATPGAWREDLSPEEIAVVERHAASLLHRFYGAAAPEPKPEAELPVTSAAEPAFNWPTVDLDPQLSATQALIDQLRAENERLRRRLAERR
jgi:hypothetical protein